MPPRLSVVMPSYNQAPFINEAIASVLDQEIDDIELIIQDGQSSDGTLDIIREWSDRDERVRCYSEPDSGQADAVNRALERTTGDIIGWLNSDDIFYPQSFAAVLRHFEKYPHAEVIYGEGDHIDPEGRFLRRHPTEDWDPERLAESVIISQPSAFLRREVVDRYGGLNESLHYCLDYEYWLRLARHGVHFQYIPWVLSATRMHPTAKTLQQRLPMHEEICAMLQQHFGRVNESWLLNYAFVAAGIGPQMSLATPFRLLSVLPLAAWAAYRWNRRVEPATLSGLGRGLRRKATRAWTHREAA